MNDDKRKDQGVHGRLYLTVAAFMAVIVGAWLILLPGQLARLKTDASSRWTDLSGESPVSIEEALAGIQAQLDELDDIAEREAATSGSQEGGSARVQATLPILKEQSGVEKQIDLLRARLEASQQNE